MSVRVRVCSFPTFQMVANFSKYSLSPSLPPPGTFPVVALMTGDAITRLTLQLPQCPPPVINDTEVVDPNVCFLESDECTPIRVDVAVTLSLLVGMLMVRRLDIVVFIVI